MSMSRRTFSKLTLAAFGAGALGSTARAVGLPAPFDKPGSVRMALVRYLSTGDFFESYLVGAKEQAEALGHHRVPEFTCRSCRSTNDCARGRLGPRLAPGSTRCSCGSCASVAHRGCAWAIS